MPSSLGVSKHLTTSVRTSVTKISFSALELNQRRGVAWAGSVVVFEIFFPCLNRGTPFLPAHFFKTIAQCYSWGCALLYCAFTLSSVKP